MLLLGAGNYDWRENDENGILQRGMGWDFSRAKLLQTRSLENLPFWAPSRDYMAGRPLLTDEQLSPAPPSLYLRWVGLLALGWVGWLALRWVGWLALRACAQPVSRANQSHLPARCPKPQSTPRSNILTCFSLRQKHNCQTDMRQKLNQPPWPGEQVILLFFSFLQSASIFWRPLQCSLTYISKTMLSVL